MLGGLPTAGLSPAKGDRMNGITAALTGRLGSDAELKYLPSGQALATVSVAVDDAKAEQGKSEWVRATVWGEQAEDLAPRLVKGTRVYLEGRVRAAPHGPDGCGGSPSWPSGAGSARHFPSMSSRRPCGWSTARWPRPAVLAVAADLRASDR